MQIDPCTSGWTRNTDGELVPLWLNGQQFPNELMKLAKQRAPMIQNPVCNKEKPLPPSPSPPLPPQALSPQQFSALAAKYMLQDGKESDDNCFAGNDGDESDINTSDNDSD